MSGKKTSAKREIMGVWGHSPQRGPGAEPLGTRMLCLAVNAVVLQRGRYPSSA